MEYIIITEIIYQIPDNADLVLSFNLNHIYHLWNNIVTNETIIVSFVIRFSAIASFVTGTNVDLHDNK